MPEYTISHPIKGNISSYELEENEALLILTSIPQIGTIKIRYLLKHFGSAKAALHAPSDFFLTLRGLGEKFLTTWINWPMSQTWKLNLLQIIKSETTLISYSSPLYPKRLLEITDAPVLLYVKGALISADHRSIAVVGTRQASIYGLEMAARFSRELTALGFTVVSGLARGIDTAAHIAALERGRTIGIIGSGLADIYPAENRRLAEHIAEKGAIISEFPMSTPPDRQNFPQRNRIVCGMTQGTLLIEAPIKSGAMITMLKGEEQGRPLFAIPGRLDHENFQGNHRLIKNRKAFLVESAEEIANHFENFLPISLISTPAKHNETSLDKEENLLLNTLPNEELTIEQIIELTKIPISALNALLMKLVLKSRIKEFPGRVYKKIGVTR